MARPRVTEPRYLEHKQSGRGRIVYWDAAGVYRDELLPGAFNSRESKEAFHRLSLEQLASPHAASLGSKQLDDLTLPELLDAYRIHAEKHYKGRSGKGTSSLREHFLVIRTMRQTYPDLNAAAFGALALKAVRECWVLAGLSRSEVNRRTRIAKQIMRWAVAEELVPGSVLPPLEAVAGLQKGRTKARETEKVKPVDDEKVDLTLPFLNRFVAGLVELQRLTGARPGEACIIRRCDIDTGGQVWLYKPHFHKTEHRDKDRVIAIGPKAQKLLKQFFTADLNAYLFPPRLAVEELHAERTKERRTPRYKSHQERNRKARKKLPERAPADYYTAESYSHAIARACDRAFPPPAPLAQREKETLGEWWGRKVDGKWVAGRLTTTQKAELKKWQKTHRWKPNQLRHTFATKVRKRHGLEAAQVILGHSKADVTQIYAERNESLAAMVAGKLG